MSIARLILREILHRKLGFVLALLAVTVAVAALVASLGLLRLHQTRTDELLAAKQAETKKKMDALEDDIRKSMLKLGFNIVILPEGQSRANRFATDYLSKTMPEAYAKKLGDAGVLSINHLLPSLEQRIIWKERDRTIFLMGVRDEVPIAKKAEKKPLQQQVPQGSIILGHDLHKSFKLKKGDDVQLLGRKFVVKATYPQRGDDDDNRAWINLTDAQELLDKPGQINGILALECNCEADRLDKVRAEVASILPGTEVVEHESKALARAEARSRAGDVAKAAQERVAAERTSEYRRQVEFAAVLAPLILLACLILVGVLLFTNVRDRASEVGLLRALGVRSYQIATLVIGRALILGCVGAVLGTAAGAAFAVTWGDRPEAACAWCTALDGTTLGLVLGLTPLVCALESAAPALRATRQDPAVVLRDN